MASGTRSQKRQRDLQEMENTSKIQKTKSSTEGSLEEQLRTYQQLADSNEILLVNLQKDNQENATRIETVSRLLKETQNDFESAKLRMGNTIAELEARQEVQLRTLKAKWERLEMAFMKPSRWVTLNVGGVVYKTTVETLAKYPRSYFQVLFNGQFDIQKNRKGEILIDRPGEIFIEILNFLRTGHKLCAPGSNDSERALTILEEAKYYCLEDVMYQHHPGSLLPFKESYDEDESKPYFYYFGSTLLRQKICLLLTFDDVPEDVTFGFDVVGNLQIDLTTWNKQINITFNPSEKSFSILGLSYFGFSLDNLKEGLHLLFDPENGSCTYTIKNGTPIIFFMPAHLTWRFFLISRIGRPLFNVLIQLHE